MEPAVIGAVGRLAAAVVQRSSAPVRGEVSAQREWSEESDERGALVVNDVDGETLAILTQDQVEQISDFLEMPECIALCQFMFIARLGMGDEEGLSFLKEEYEETFKILSEEYCDENGYNWANLAGAFWRLLVEHMQSAFPSERISSLISTTEMERISSYVGATQKIGGKNRPANIAFREIVDILGSPDRFQRARNVLSDIRNASERRYSELNLTHTFSHASENFRFDHEVLYVPRNLRLQNSDETRSDSFLVSPLARPRCVVIGSPGVGKSTMTQNLVHQLSDCSDEISPFAPLVISCKDVPNPEGNAFILGAVTRSLRENLQLDIDEEAVNDLATLGRAFIIFDAIDEIIDITRRQNFVKTVESFAVRYPLIPILVTARRVGYSKARFSVREFETYELDDFSDEQVVEYTKRWFDITDRSEEERLSFLRETENVPDVRTNPLMLSLLCALYRARGYIPRNRRKVYESCADLLFQRWDAMRHIDQPIDHRQYGTRLMQELALFFYKSQTAQTGVQEGQLRKLISQFFTDTASVDEDDARMRAQDFLNFCADRAWLLSYQGTDHLDQRLFGFTHRTFMEYFAAEAIVRRSRSLDEIVTEVAKAYERDASSVLADVIFQCADDKYDGGAREVVSGLMEKARGIGRQNAAKYLSLCLRIMNSAPLPPHSTEAIFEALLRHWSSVGAEETQATAMAVFELSRDPRNRFISMLKSNRDWAESALSRWARFYWRAEISMFDVPWNQLMYEVANEISELKTRDPALAAYMLHNALIPDGHLLQGPKEWLLGFNAYGKIVPGPLFADLEAYLWGSDNTEAGMLVSRFMESGIASNLRINGDFLFVVYNEVSYRNDLIPWQETLESIQEDSIRDFLLWSCCLLYEILIPSFHSFHELIDFVYGEAWFLRAASTRVNGPGRTVIDSPRPFSDQELQEEITEGKVPAWFAEWCTGRVSFLPDPNQTR